VVRRQPETALCDKHLAAANERPAKRGNGGRAASCRPSASTV